MLLEHAERLIQRRHQALGTEVIGGNKAIVAAAEDAKAGSHSKRWRDIGDGALLGQGPQMVTAFQKHLHQIGPGGTPSGEQGFEVGTPGGVLKCLRQAADGLDALRSR